MKRLIVALVLCLLVAGCYESRMTTWAMTSQETDVLGRVGVRDEALEIGGTFRYDVSSQIDWGPQPDALGAYLIYHATLDAGIEDTPDTGPLGPILEALHARPYAGIELTGSTEDKARKADYNYIAGSSFTVGPDGNIALVVEYNDGDYADGDMYVGAMVRF